MYSTGLYNYKSSGHVSSDRKKKFKFPSRFVSDHSPAACQALLQHRLIQANQKTQQGSGSAPEAARTYPLSLLEWTANRKKANLALHVHCFDGEIDVALVFSCANLSNNEKKDRNLGCL